MGDRAGARAGQRGARAALCVLFGVVAVTSVWLTGQELATRGVAVTAGGGDERVEAGPGRPTLTAPVVIGAVRATGGATDGRPMSHPPTAARSGGRRHGDGAAAGLDRWDTTAIDIGDRRDDAATAFGQQAVDDPAPAAGAVHGHLAPITGALPEVRAPVMETGRSSFVGAPDLFGWDGGEFWFGPRGLVRVREAGR